jgi:glutamyl-tRNA synthetase
MKYNDKIVTRFAPSPTGFLHCGGIRTALYNYLFAKQNGGKMILRIEDTDEKRFDPEAEDYIKRALEWVGITADEDPWKGGPNGPYRQSERDYSNHVKTLLDSDQAYYSFDTEMDIKLLKDTDQYFTYNFKTRGKLKNSLNLSKEEVNDLLSKGHAYTIRFKVPENTDVSFTDIIRGDVSINSNQIDDKILIKSTGMVSYHMANVCDDHDMGVTHVLRGEEWIASTPFHILLYKAFGWDVPQFAHLPSILRPDGKGKLSKRDGVKYGIPVFPFGGEGLDDRGNVVKYKGFKDEGFDPDAVTNFLLLLGWAPNDDRELYSIDEMISDFSLDRVHKSGARFDIDKAKWFNSSYLQNRSDVELLNHIDCGGDYTYDSDKLSLIVDLCKKRSTFKTDMQVVADIFFKPVVLTDKSSLSDDYKKVFVDFVSKADKIDWLPENIKQLIYDICAENGVKMGKIMPSLRLAVTGGVPGPDLMTTLYILGKDESLSRVLQTL